MAFVGSQVALNAVTATPLYAFEATNSGTKDDPVPVTILCTSAIVVGGPGVTAATGFALPAGIPINLQVFGSSEILYAIVSTGTPSVSVLMGRQ
jgi:hypothetical protein